jgi:hypothetical protein
MKKAFFYICILLFATMACSLPQLLSTPNEAPVTVVPVQATEDLVVLPTATQQPAQPPSFDGVPVAFGALHFVIPPGMASGASGTQLPRVEGDDAGPWELTPGHIQLMLEGYVLREKFHQPQIFVYPAQAYAEMYPAAFESIHRLDNILYGPGAPVSIEQLPLVPFFNAGQVFASNIQVISFQNGQGVRFLTEYTQYAASANNHDLFYHFQGLTRDGAYYIIAILPVTAPGLAETSDAAAALPLGGVPYPDIADPNADFQGYYIAVAALLDATSPESFAPALGQLDAFIQSMQVTP